MVTNAVRMGIRRVVAAGVVARSGLGKRSMSKVSSNIIEQQKRFQQNPHLHGADNPTYLKGGTEDLVMNVIGGALVFTGLYKVGSGLYSMAFGVNVLEIE